MFRKFEVGVQVMNEGQRNRLVELKLENQKHRKKLQWKNNALMQECLNTLGNYQIISDEDAVHSILEIANSERIERIHHSDKPMLKKNHSYYVIWDNEELPIIKCNGHDILENWIDVIAVAFDTCFVDSEDETGILVRC